MLNLQSTLTPRAGVIQTRLADGDAVLLDMDSRRYYSLNETGARIWELIGQKRTLGQIAGELERSYDVAADAAGASVLRVAADLVEQQLATIDAAA